MNAEHEVQRLQQVRSRLNAEADRLMLEYAWLRLEGLQLYQELRPITNREHSWMQAGQHFLEAYERLEAESEQFHTACEHYLRDSMRLRAQLGPLMGGADQWALNA